MSTGTPQETGDNIDYSLPPILEPFAGARAMELSTSPFDGPALLRAQHEYIEALHDYANLSDAAKFIKAQETFIRVQSAILRQVRVI